MIPNLIEEYFNKIKDKSVRPENKQFYVATLREIVKQATKVLETFDKEQSK